MSTVDTIRKTREIIRSWEEKRMTIAEAVELYNEIRDKIKKMDELMARIFANNQSCFSDPMHIDHFYVRAKDMQEIADFLTEYKEYLKKELDATFEPNDAGNG